MRKHVLFVCTGNTCRSPMAEAMFRQLLEERGLAHRITVSSAGLGAFDGDGAADGARKAMAERGLSLDDHRSRRVDSAIVEGADLILAMTVSHRDRLREAFPHKAHQVYTLKEYGGVKGESLDVPDPFGQADERYRNVAAEMWALLERVLDRWLREEGGGSGEPTDNGHFALGEPGAGERGTHEERNGAYAGGTGQ